MATVRAALIQATSRAGLHHLYRRRLALLLPVVLLCSFGRANASALLPADLRAVGDHLLTVDTITGLRWLDLTETDGQSLNEVIAQLVSGGALEGFRYATLAEVYALWSHADIDTTGLPDPAGSGTVGPEPSVPNFVPVAAFQDLVGLTDVGCCGTVDSIGLVSDYDLGSPGDHIIAMARIFTFGTFAGKGLVTATAGRAPDHAGHNVGSWLVEGVFVPLPPPPPVPPPPPPRVPEPTLFALSSLGGLAIAVRRLRNRWNGRTLPR